MARTNSEITPAERQEYAKFCIEHGIIGDGSQDDQDNADFISNYFVNTWKEDITEKNLNTVWDHIRPHLKFYTPAQHKWYQTAQQNRELAYQLVAHLATQGRPGQLVNDGDPLFENLTLLFEQIHSRRETVSPQTIANAENRITNRPGRKLHYVQAPRRIDPVSRLAKEDAEYSIGKPFSGSDLVKNADGSYRSKTPIEQRRDTEAAERAKSQPQPTTPLSAADDRWKSMAFDVYSYHGPGHVRVRHVYKELVAQGTPWRQVYETCKQLRNQAMQEQAS
jgi:hypothetical protein